MSETTVVKPPRFKATDFGRVEHKSADWHLTLHENQTLDDVSDPHLWRDILGKQEPGQTVAVWKPDSSQWAKFVIFEVSQNFIRLGKVESAQVPVVEEPDGPLKLKWNPGKKSFDVVRERDGYKVAGPFQTKVSAVEWISDNAAKMAA